MINVVIIEYSSFVNFTFNFFLVTERVKLPFNIQYNSAYSQIGL